MRRPIEKVMRASLCQHPRCIPLISTNRSANRFLSRHVLGQAWCYRTGFRVSVCVGQTFAANQFWAQMLWEHDLLLADLLYQRVSQGETKNRFSRL